MTLSTSGLIGALVGFLLAVTFYFVTSRALKGASGLGETAQEREQKASVIGMVLLADIPILTAVGYFCGQALE